MTRRARDIVSSGAVITDSANSEKGERGLPSASLRAAFQDGRGWCRRSACYLEALRIIERAPNPAVYMSNDVREPSKKMELI